MDQAEWELRRTRFLRRRALIWTAIVLAALAVGLTVAAAIDTSWSYFAGAVLVVALIVVGQKIHLRNDRARLLREFPELRDAELTRTTWL